MQWQILLSLVPLFTRVVLGQALVPFSVDGALDDAAVTAGCSAINCGGTVSVNGFTITIPKNTLIAFPAAFIPFKQVAEAISNYRGMEVAIDGNIKDGLHIAGLFSIAQFALQLGMGHIESIQDDGRMKLVDGPTIRINDPNAVYSAGYTLDPFFTADDENPSITAFSGFPMCIPRNANDVLCPQTNRPMNGQTPVLDFFAPDPLVMAPFKPGDHLSFSGRKVGNEIICYNIVAENVQIRTNPGNPTYIRMEDAIVGVFDTNPNAEMADTRFIGMLSDASASVSIFALDVDPCTGEEKERQVGNAVVRNGDVRNKWIWRADSTTFNKYTREYIIKVNSGQVTTKNGIQAGQYVQPVTEWIMPEANVPGLELPPYTFAQFTHLTNGFGPFVEGDATIFGPLDPFPGPTQPPAPTCSVTQPAGETPIAEAGPAQTLIAGAQVALSGSNTNPNLANGNLNFLWTQTSGPALGTGANKLTNPTTPSPTFVAPQTATTYEFTLQLCVKDSAGASIPTQCSTDTVLITIQTKASNPAVTDIVTIDSYTWVSSQSGTISVACHSNVVDGTANAMTLIANTLNGGQTAMVLSAGSPGRFTFQSRSVKRPGAITCSSRLGGSASTATTTQKRSLIGEIENSTTE